MVVQIRSGVQLGCAFSPNIIDWILVQAVQNYSEAQVGTNVHVLDPTYADDIVILSINYREMQGLVEAVNHQPPQPACALTPR